MKLSGKVAVVTGGARDLGRAISVKLAAEGAKVCLNYFDNPEDAEVTINMIKEQGGEAIAVQGDMTKAADVKNLFAKAGEAYGGKVDILVNEVIQGKAAYSGIKTIDYKVIKEKSNPLEGTYILDIIRQQWKNNDERLR